jgi:phosphoribosylpyrophosphate synthetase
MKEQLSKYHNIGINYVMLDKTRKEANIDEMIIIGDVFAKNIIILDDMIDTAGTLCKAADVLKLVLKVLEQLLAMVFYQVQHIKE